MKPLRLEPTIEYQQKLDDFKTEKAGRQEWGTNQQSADIPSSRFGQDTRASEHAKTPDHETVAERRAEPTQAERRAEPTQAERRAEPTQAERRAEPTQLRAGNAFHKSVQGRETDNFESERRVDLGRRSGRIDLYADQGDAIFIEELKGSDLDRMSERGTLDRNIDRHAKQLAGYEDGIGEEIRQGQRDVQISGALRYDRPPEGEVSAGEGVREHVEIRHAYEHGHQVFFDSGTDGAEEHLTRLPPNERSWEAITTMDSAAGRPGSEYLDARGHAKQLRAEYNED
jgi:hypothetical protein